MAGLKKIAIVGDGYTAADLLRLLVGHDEIEVETILSTEDLVEELTASSLLTGYYHLVCDPSQVENLRDDVTRFFWLCPTGFPFLWPWSCWRRGFNAWQALRADFRLKDPGLYEKYYDKIHEAPGDAGTGRIRPNWIIPGSGSNRHLGGQHGLLSSGAVSPGRYWPRANRQSRGIIVDSKSGVSGAGRGSKEASHFCEVNKGFMLTEWESRTAPRR